MSYFWSFTNQNNGDGIGLEEGKLAADCSTDYLLKYRMLWRRTARVFDGSIFERTEKLTWLRRCSGWNSLDESEWERKSFLNFKKKDKQRNKNFSKKTSLKENSPYWQSEAKIDRHLNIHDLRIYCSCIHFELLMCKTWGSVQKLKWGLINL